MRNAFYPLNSYRIANEVRDELKEMKLSKGISFNQLFVLLLNTYHEHEVKKLTPNPQENPQ